MNRLRLVDPIERVVPALERLVDERDWQRQKELFRRWIPEQYKRAFDVWASETKNMQSDGE